MKPPSAVVAALAVLAACGHAPPKGEPPATASVAEPDPEPVAEPEPDVIAEETADGGPTLVPAGTPPVDGCVFTTAPGVTDPAGISIIGLGEGGGGYDMPDICPAQACSAGLTIELPKAGDWGLGTYDVTIATDRGTLRCNHVAKPPPRWTAPAKCAHVPELTADCVGPQPLWMGPVMISGAPTTARVSITLDGKVLADETFSPWYSAKRWDGWDCDRSCRSAKATAEVR